MFSKCLYVCAKIFIQFIEGQLFCLRNINRNSNTLLKAQKKLILILLNIIRLKFIFQAFQFFYMGVIKPCFRSGNSKPYHLKRKLSRGIFPLTLVFFLVLVIHPTIWFNRIFAFMAAVYSFLVFKRNNFLPDGLYNPKKLVKNNEGRFEYYGERPLRYKQQILMFESIFNHIQNILPKFKYKFNPVTENAEFMRVGYCQFSGVL